MIQRPRSGSQCRECDNQKPVSSTPLSAYTRPGSIYYRRACSSVAAETDQALFQRRLRKALRSHPVHCYPASVKEFLRGLDGHTSDNGQLRWSLLYTQVGFRAEREARSEFCGLREKSQFARPDPTRPHDALERLISLERVD